jgi:UDP-GlcNAc:undecaprenyl-phosphate GlcNAc-1-phosphate transferase
VGSLFLQSAVAFFSALAASVLLTWGVRRLALERNWLKQPTPDRWHVQATPTLGGLAFFLAFAATAAAFGLLAERQVQVLSATAAGVFLLGLADDRKSLPPVWKFLGQLLAAVVLASSGLVLQLTRVPAVDYALTLLWIVGITNAFNLLDNMNGLSAGVAAIVAGFRAVLFLLEGQAGYALLCVAFVGAVLGFLFFNFPKGRIFMGDAGSLFLGFWLAGVTLLGVYPYTRGYVALLFFPVLAMSVPILDTTLVTLTRSLRGRSIAQGGKDHTSHRLVGYGFSETKAVLLLWALSFGSGAIGISTTFFGISRVIPIVVLALLVLAVFGTYLARLELGYLQREEDAPKFPRRLRVLGVASTAVFDLILAVVSYYSAYLLRFELDLVPGVLRLFLNSVAEIALIKLAVLTAMGIYRGWWRYFGLDDTLRLARASVVASAAAMAYFFSLYRLEGFPRSVFFLDLFIFSCLLLAFRFSFRIMDRWAPLPATSSTRVLIFAPDDMGELALRLILRQRKLKAVGFLSRDGERRDYKIHSVPVLGSVQELEEVARRAKADGVVMASAVDAATLATLELECRRLGLIQYSAVMQIQEVQRASNEELLGAGESPAERPAEPPKPKARAKGV